MIGASRGAAAGGVAIPDSENLHVSYIISDQTESDGQTVDPLSDQTENGYNASAVGTPTMDIDGFNGNPAAILNGTDSAWDSTIASISQPFTVYAVVDLDSGINTSDIYTILEGNGTDDRLIYRWDSENWEIWAGSSFLTGSSDETANLHTGIFDGANSEIYTDESIDNSGTNVGSNDLKNNAIGYQPVGESNTEWFDGLFVELHVYNTRHDSTTRSEVWSWIKNRTF